MGDYTKGIFVQFMQHAKEKYRIGEFLGEEREREIIWQNFTLSIETLSICERIFTIFPQQKSAFLVSHDFFLAFFQNAARYS